jgi:hypothetical protein
MEALVPAQLTSPSRVAGLRRTPCDVPGTYASVGPGGRALLRSFLGPAQCTPGVG